MDDEEKRDGFLTQVQDILAGVLIFILIGFSMYVW